MIVKEWLPSTTALNLYSLAIFVAYCFEESGVNFQTLVSLITDIIPEIGIELVFCILSFYPEGTTSIPVPL